MYRSTAWALLLVVGCGGDAAPGPDSIDAAAASADSVTLIFSRGESPAPVRRAVSDSPANVQQALELLVQGPTPDEEAMGLHSWFSAGTADVLRSVDVDTAGHAVIDFAGVDTVIPNASTSAGSALLLMQLNGTVFQFPEVRIIEYRLGGSCDAFGEWLQYGCVMQTRQAWNRR